MFDKYHTCRVKQTHVSCNMSCTRHQVENILAHGTAAHLGLCVCVGYKDRNSHYFLNMQLLYCLLQADGFEIIKTKSTQSEWLLVEYMKNMTVISLNYSQL